MKLAHIFRISKNEKQAQITRMEGVNVIFGERYSTIN